MRRTFRTHRSTLTLMAAAVALSLAFTTTAMAGGGHHDRHGNGAVYAAVAGLAIYSAVSHARRRGGDYAGRHHSRHGGHVEHGRRRSHSGYYSGGECHTVYKHGYYHGREARIGGTQCYDSYGNPYIVRGSRYVVEYY